MHETLIKRVLYTVKCDCKEEPFQKEWTENPPREIQCPDCSKWHTPKEESYIGKDKLDKL